MPHETTWFVNPRKWADVGIGPYIRFVINET